MLTNMIALVAISAQAKVSVRDVEFPVTRLFASVDQKLMCIAGESKYEVFSQGWILARQGASANVSGITESGEPFVFSDERQGWTAELVPNQAMLAVYSRKGISLFGSSSWHLSSSYTLASFAEVENGESLDIWRFEGNDLLHERASDGSLKLLDKQTLLRGGRKLPQRPLLASGGRIVYLTWGKPSLKNDVCYDVEERSLARVEDRRDRFFVNVFLLSGGEQSLISTLAVSKDRYLQGHLAPLPSFADKARLWGDDGSLVLAFDKQVVAVRLPAS